MADRWQSIDLRTDVEDHDFVTVDPADVLAHVAGLLERPAWHSKAACHGKTELFYLGKGQSMRPAVAVCADCPVKTPCLQAALETTPTDDFGVWAGTSARDRSHLRRTIADEAA